MVGRWINEVPGSLALVIRSGRWWRLPWRFGAAKPVRRRIMQACPDGRAERVTRFRYHLGRGRRAREAGRYERGVIEARRALALNGGDPWALALLGQCLLRQQDSDLTGARRALERACALAPSNGYFVGLLLDVLKAQGDAEAARNLLTWAWWHGAPVERWLPEGPPLRAGERRAAPTGADTPSVAPTAPSVKRSTGGGPLLTGARPMFA